MKVNPQELYQQIALQIAGAELSSEGTLHLRIQGSSMRPLLWPGDLIQVQPLEPERLKPGLILSFQQDEGLTTHRLVRIQPNQLILKGDAHDRFDLPVERRAVLGQAVAVQRGDQRFALPGGGWTRFSAWIAWFSALEGDLYQLLGGKTPQEHRTRERVLRGIAFPLRGVIYLGLLFLSRQLR